MSPRLLKTLLFMLPKFSYHYHKYLARKATIKKTCQNNLTGFNYSFKLSIY
jgi:hypothetical protein